MSLQSTENSPAKDKLFSAIQIMPVVPGKMTVAINAGAVLTRGALLDSNGALVAKTVSGDTTTYTEPFAVLAEDTDTRTATKVAPVYYTGEFNQDALTVNPANTSTAADYVVSARKVGIFIKQNI